MADPMPATGLIVEIAQRGFERGADTAFRLFHGRGRTHPGYEQVSVDRFGDCLHVSLHNGDSAFGRAIAADLFAALPVAGITLQLRDGRRTQTEVVHGDVPERIEVVERGIRYVVELRRNQNVGLFLDMARAREWLMANADGANLLNLFAFTCAFSVVAIAGGARQVVNNDMSRNALDWGSRNHALNGHDPGRVRMLPHNVFKSWWKIRQFGPYDIVVIDPPSRQRGSFVAEKQYGQVLKRLPELCAPGARVLACLNSPFLPFHFLEEQMMRWCPAARLVERLPAPADFADVSVDAALKIGLFRYGSGTPAGG